MDLTLHDLRPVDRPGLRLDIGIEAGRIVAMRPDLPRAPRAQDFGGRLAIGGLVESHVHLDKVCILERCAAGGGIREAIAEVSRLKADFTEEDVAARAGAVLRRAITSGTTLMRTHVEVDPRVGLRGLSGVRAAIADWAWAIDVSVCVFPQEGLTDDPGADDLLVEALEAGGIEAVGGAPYADTDPHAQIDRIFDLARAYDVDVDLHLDLGDTAEGMTIGRVIERTAALGWGGRVTVGHVTRFAQLPRPEFAALSRRLADAGIAATVLPATDLFLTHRGHGADHSPPRGVTPAHLMAEDGVVCSLSSNNVLNPFTPFGGPSALRMAHLYALIAQIGEPSAMAGCLDMVTAAPARLMRRPDYGLRVGNPADVVVLDATDPARAVAEPARAVAGFKRGVPVFVDPPPVLMAPPAGA